MSCANRLYRPGANDARLRRFMDHADPMRTAAYATGTITTRGPSSLETSRLPRKERLRKWQTTPDREASMKRRRMLGSSSNMPPDMRVHFTQGERAALAIIGEEVRKHGRCDWPIDRIAAVAGVSRTTVQNAVRAAMKNNLINRQDRPIRGWRNLTNIITITAKAWLTWLGKGARSVREIGFKLFRPSKSTEKTRASEVCRETRKGLGKRVLWQGNARAQGQHGGGGTAP